MKGKSDDSLVHFYFIRLSVLLSVCLSNCLPACLSAFLPFCLPISPYLYLSDKENQFVPIELESGSCRFSTFDFRRERFSCSVASIIVSLFRGRRRSRRRRRRNRDEEEKDNHESGEGEGQIRQQKGHQRPTPTQEQQLILN